MKIGIIGAGNIGATLARKLSALGHEVKIANSKGPDFLRDLAGEIGAEAASAEDAVAGAEVVILSVPFASFGTLAPLIGGVPADTVIIDTSNYYPFRDGTIDDVDGGKPESIWVSEQLGRAVVKAWNAGLAHTLAEKGTPPGTPGRIALPIAGGEDAAKRVAIELVEGTGFDAIDAGSLDDSWRFQPGTPAYCTELAARDLVEALAAAERDRAPANRETLIQYFMANYETMTHEGAVARNRSETA